MKRLSIEQKELIRNLSNKGLSLRQIQRKTNIHLGSIQYHLSKNSTRKRIRPIKIPSSDLIKGEIIGAFAGDGCYYHCINGRSSKHAVRFCLSYKLDKEYARHLISIMEKMNLKVNTLIRKHKGKPSSIEVRTFSLNFINFIKDHVEWEGKKTYSIRLRGDIKFNQNFLLGFARGLMDTDGFVETSCVSCGVTSKRLIEDLNKIFENISITPKITIKQGKGNRKKLYLLRIPKKFLKIYDDKISFSNIRKRERLLGIINK